MHRVTLILYSLAFGLIFIAVAVLSLPLNVIAVMRLLGWEWWTALIGILVFICIPVIGQLGYVILALMGAYYFYQADFQWREATNSVPKSWGFSAETWTQEQQLNAQNFIQALNSRNEAVRQQNNLSPALAPVDREKLQLIIVKIRAAYTYSAAVSDDVLDKIHPDLRHHWKNEFVEGLRLRISNLESSQGDVQAEIRGTALLEAFGNWLEANRRQIRIPK